MLVKNYLARATATVIIIINNNNNKPTNNNKNLTGRDTRKRTAMQWEAVNTQNKAFLPTGEKRTREVESVEGLCFMHISFFVGWAFFNNICMPKGRI